MEATSENHYEILGLDRNCTPTQIRDAYRLLAKRYHPDLNPNSAAARSRTEALNAAYEILRAPARRRAYDRALDQASQAAAPGRGAKIEENITQEVRLRIEDFLRGTSLDVQVKDPANRDGPETYRVTIPPMSAPGTRLRLPRVGTGARGFVQLRLKLCRDSVSRSGARIFGPISGLAHSGPKPAAAK
ncbi:MAG: DnaJ domain-containing protein [Chthoniobacterales bacterium]|nr:DnaJ domain-containing protein [Chthoniobacterales bacterium]